MSHRIGGILRDEGSGQRKVIIEFWEMKVLGLGTWMFKVSGGVYCLEGQTGLTVKDSVPRDTAKNLLGFDFVGPVPPQTGFSVNEKAEAESNECRNSARYTYPFSSAWNWSETTTFLSNRRYRWI